MLDDVAFRCANSKPMLKFSSLSTDTSCTKVQTVGPKVSPPVAKSHGKSEEPAENGLSRILERSNLVIVLRIEQQAPAPHRLFRRTPNRATGTSTVSSFSSYSEQRKSRTHPLLPASSL